MSYKSVAALFLLVLFVAAVPAIAQETEPEPDFKLLRGSTTDAELEMESEEAELWVPEIRAGDFEFSFALGFLNLNQTIWSHDQIIYKYITEATYWGDVKITGKSAFEPALRLGYNFAKWFCLEGVGSFSTCDYTSTIVNRSRRSNEPGAPVDTEEPPLGEYDAEARSLITVRAGLNALVYPLNIGGDSTGRFQPYVQAGYGRRWYDMNSAYNDDSTAAADINVGAGLRFLADKTISIRFEVAFHRSSVQFTPVEYFAVLNENTTKVPLNEYPLIDDSIVERRVTEYSEQTINALNWSIGFQATF